MTKKIEESLKKIKGFEKFNLTKNIYQNKHGIYSSKNKEDKLIGKIYIQQITITKDLLELFDPVFTLKYYDAVFNEFKVIEDVPFKVLIQKLESEKLFLHDNKGIEKLFNEIIIQCTDKKINGIKFIQTDTKVFKEGFFLKNDKVIENTLITHLETDKEQIKESIKLINELLSTRGLAVKNDCTLLRFMLWSPFAWCLKEIGKTKGLYGLILTGSPKTSKTGSCINFSWIYSTPEDREKAVSTTSVFGSRLEESTLPAIIDEAHTLISREDMQDPMKRCIYNKNTRSVKDKKNPQNTIEYYALGLPIFTMNEYNEFKNFITRRYTINYYPSNMTVTDKEVTEFEKKYSPEYKNSPLKLLRHLGRAFADKMIPYIESKSDKLNNIETLTIKILKQIANEANEEFNKSIYEIQEPTDNFEQDKQTTIRKGLNKLFRTNHHISPNTIYTFKDFINCGNNGEINWLYHKNPNKFVINKKEFEKEVSQIVGENMDYKSILNEIEIPTENISPKVIHTNRGNTRGFEISFEELSNNMFDMHIPFGKNT